MDITRAEKKRKTKAAGGGGAAMHQKHQFRLPGSENQRRDLTPVMDVVCSEKAQECCAFGCLLFLDLMGTNRALVIDRTPVCVHIIRSPLFVLKKNKHFLAFSKVTNLISCYLVA